MERVPISPRADWQQIVESQGFHFHSPEGQPYWDESAYYRFDSAEVDRIETATCELNDLCLKAVEEVIRKGWIDRFGIPKDFVNLVVQSWEKDEHTIYGRFDLLYDGQNPPKLLEYNADTPTALLEAAVIQWYWLKELFPEADQFNSIHERLIEAWSQISSKVQGILHFAAVAGNVEDYMTVNYLRDTAMQAGLTTEYIDMEKVGWDSSKKMFVDENNRPIRNCFKLYPWEWLLKEKFGVHLLSASTDWLEPPWKMLLSNKAILPILFKLFPGSPYLLRAELSSFGSSFVKKPILGREGANVTSVVSYQKKLETEGPYGDGPFVYQQWQPPPDFAGNYPVIGSWLVNGHACGMGIREDSSPITRNTSRFVPHVF